MGRAIDVDKRLDSLEHKINEVMLILEEFSQTNTKKENIDIHEATKEKSNNKGNGKGDVKPDNGKSKSNSKHSGDSKSSK